MALLNEPINFEVATMIFALDRQNHVPLYAQIVAQVRQMITTDALKIGDRLPANRVLAQSLGVNRTTVTTAYEELIAEGLLASRVGSGTYVAAQPPRAKERAETSAQQLTPLNWEALLTSLPPDEWLSNRGLRGPKEGIWLTHALPATELFPLEEFRRATDRVLRREGRSLLQLGTSHGYEPLQQYLLQQMGLVGIDAAPDELLVTSGCQQALDLLRQILLAPGDEVVIENPTYPGALSLFCQPQYKFISVPVNENGLDLDVLEDVLQQRRPKLIYLVPTFHNPTGVTMDLAARKRLIELAARHRVPIVEDEIYRELRYDGAALPSLKALDPYGVVIYLNSFSKAAFPGLRVGWMVAPRPVIEHLHALKQRTDLHGSLLAQAAICEWARSGEFTKHVARCRRSYKQRRDALFAALEKHFPDNVRWTKPDGGMTVWVTLPPACDAQRLLVAAEAQGVSFTPGSRFFASHAQRNTLRLSFTRAQVGQFDEAVSKLAIALHEELTHSSVKPTARAMTGNALM
jgi:2-aminoadipate transaminase